MSGLDSLVRYLERDGGIPSASDFEKAGLFLTGDGCSVVGDRMHCDHKISSALHGDFKIVGMILENGRKKGRFLVYHGPESIDEKLIHTYESESIGEEAIYRSEVVRQRG
jgi:hypothetical protein